MIYFLGDNVRVTDIAINSNSSTNLKMVGSNKKVFAVPENISWESDKPDSRKVFTAYGEVVGFTNEKECIIRAKEIDGDFIAPAEYIKQVYENIASKDDVWGLAGEITQIPLEKLPKIFGSGIDTYNKVFELNSEKVYKKLKTYKEWDGYTIDSIVELKEEFGQYTDIKKAVVISIKGSYVKIFTGKEVVTVHTKVLRDTKKKVKMSEIMNILLNE